jgi:TolA-binding protein
MAGSEQVQRFGFKLWAWSLGLLVATTSACSSTTSLSGNLPAPTSRAVERERTFDAPLVSSPAPAGAVSAASTTPVDDTVSGRDTRRSTLQPRARALVVTEVQGLESLLQVTQPTSQDRPLLLRRLAEDYVELEHASKGTVAVEARRRAIARYLELTTRYPGYAQGDEALYYLGYEYEQANDGHRALKTYFELLQKRPDSKYIPNAYLAFGELFFKEASTDATKWPVAREAYAKVISSTTPADTVYAYACYKLAHVFANLGDKDSARKAFQKTVDYTVAHSELPNAAKLEDMARRDLVALDAEMGVTPLVDGATGGPTTGAASPEE